MIIANSCYNIHTNCSERERPSLTEDLGCSMNKAGMNLVGVKEFNRSLILQNICTGTEMTRFKLAKMAHLSSMTVTNVTSELLEMGVIVEEDSTADVKSVGRSPKILSLSPDSPVALGIWISKDFLYGMVTDMSLRPQYCKRVLFEEQETKESVLEKISALVTDLRASTQRRILGLGLAVIGIIDAVEGGIRYVTDFHNIEAMAICPYLKTRFDFPVYIINDAQAAGLGELYYGLGREEDSFLYVGVDNGIGAAVVSNRFILKNTVDACGELGHMSIDYNGPKCPCGSRGCLELYASSTNILNQINEECSTNFSSFAEVMEFCRVSSRAYSVLYNCSKQLTYALNSCVNLIDTSTIVFGHAGYYLPEEILKSMEDMLNRISVLKYTRSFRLLHSSFGENAAVFGAACLVLEKLFNGVIAL